MKTIQNLISIGLLLIGAITFAQDTTQKDKLSFHSFSLSPEVFSEGFAITGELSYNINKNIFSFSATLGEEIGIFGRGDRFQQLNFLYGRELKLKEWFFIDLHAGGGLFLYNNDYSHLAEIGVPLVTKLRFRTGDKFSIGLKFQANINTIENIYSVGILLQFN